jgi:rSAM/selenodomain-associated transferase 1
MENFPTRKPPRNRLMIFARVPELGQVKTRLARDLGAHRTLTIYEAMLRDLLHSIGSSGDDFDVEIFWTGSPDVDGARLRRYFGDHQLSRQAGRDLGERLGVAFTEKIAFYRAEKLIAIGTDDPSLSRETIQCAFRLLESCEWVMGPAADGGYYLIGCRAASFTADIFEGIRWGSPEVYAATAEAIRISGGSLAVLPTRSDLDNVEELRSYMSIAAADTRVSEILRSWGWSR